MVTAPVVAAGAASVLPAGAPTDEIVVGATVYGDLPLSRSVYAELGAAGGSRLALAPAADVWAGVRLRPSPAVPVSFLAGGGARVRGGVAPEAIAGVGLDLPSERSLHPHADLAWLGAFPGGPPESALLLTIGVSYRRPDPPPPAPAPVEAPPAPAAVSLTLEPSVPGAQVWLPHPVCDWVPVEEVGAHLAGQPPPITATVHAPGYVPAEVSLGAETAVSLTREAPQGALIVVAQAGDRVTVAGAPITLGGDATAVLTVAEGPVSVQVVGGGRSVQTRVAVMAGLATWVRAEPAEPWVVRFAVGSATPTAASRREVQARLPDLGDAVLGVRGSYSPEGTADLNERLADERARATRDLLVSLGVPAERVQVLPSTPPADGADATEQRVATVAPLWPGATP